MSLTISCPNCGHKSPWESRPVPIEVWCANCCSYDADERRPVWVYNFVVLPNPRCNPKRRPDENRNLYGGWSLR